MSILREKKPQQIASDAASDALTAATPALINEVMRRLQTRFFTKKELFDSGALDARYYTRTAIDTLLAAYVTAASLATNLLGYALLAGRAGGQTLKGGTASGDDLTLESTSHATKGEVTIQPNGGYTRLKGGASVDRGSNSNGALIITGASMSSHFCYDTAEDTYIRGGKDTSQVHIGDANAQINIGGGGASTYFGGNIGVAWVDLTYNTGWADYDAATWQKGQYKKVGDLVFLRGLVKRTSGSATLIATLPSGYIPPVGILTAQFSDAGVARVDVQNDGGIYVSAGGTTYLGINLYFSVAT